MANCPNHPDKLVHSRGLCKNCYNKQWYANTDPEIRKERQKRKHRKKIEPKRRQVLHRKYRYGLSQDQYDNMVKAQDGVCFCCREKSKRLVVDHNHLSGKVRKLLCDRCNYIVGAIEDRRYKAALEYLDTENRLQAVPLPLGI